jgi:hypothetical protein
VKLVELIVAAVDELGLAHTPVAQTDTSANCWFNISYGGSEAYRLIIAKKRPWVRVMVINPKYHPSKPLTKWSYPGSKTDFDLHDPERFQAMMTLISTPPGFFLRRPSTT